MRGRLVMRFVVLVAAAAALPANGQVITGVTSSGPIPPQIAPEPLADGVRAYVNRVHLFRNIPAGLVGAQYVQISNDGKNFPQFELRVTIGQPGTLYLILDNRVGTNLRDPTISPDLIAAGMTWVPIMGFTDTGMKMALDEGANGSIDNYFSVYSLPVTPGEVVLKTQYDLSTGGPYDRNMYTVAAAAVHKASNPVPADGAWTSASPLLQWTAGIGAVLHNVSVGTSPQLGPADLVGSQLSVPHLQYPGELIPDTTYYWRVDEIQADGVTVNAGEVWTFTVMSIAARNPSPADGTPWVDLNVTLSWKPGLNAVVHSLYFGTDRAAVESGAPSVFRGTQFPTTWTAPVLDPNTTYFWRIDEVNADGDKEPGPVWSFSTIRQIAIGDPNLLGWWKMDEGMGAKAVDWSGGGHHAQFAKPAPTWAPGLVGGALQFAGTGDSAVHADGSFLNGRDALTVMAWVKSDVTQTDKGFIIFEDPIGSDNVDMRYDAQGVTAGGWNLIKAGITVSDGGIGSVRQIESSNDSQTTDWQHLAMTWASGQALQLYINGELDSPTAAGGPIAGVLANFATILIGKGGKDTIGSSWDGLIDELRIYDRALTQPEIQAVMRGDPARAWSPSPANGVTANVFDALPMTWKAGDKAVAHDVYLGADRTAVSEATVFDTTGVYRGRQADASYMPAPLLELVVRYFWRIDEVNADGTISRGVVWDFMLDD